MNSESLPQSPNVYSCAVSPEFSEHGLSLQADRSRRLRVEQRTSRFVDDMTLNASLVTDVMPVLSQMILDRLIVDRVDLCLGVKTPGFSYHSLFQMKTFI